MKEHIKKNIVFYGISASIFLFFVFGVLQEKEAKFLGLSSEWIFISILPIVLALFIGGHVTKFKGFGVELEAALKTSPSISSELNTTDVLANIDSAQKERGSYLDSLTDNDASKMKILVFRLGKKNYYDPGVTKEYIRRFNNLEFIEIRDGDQFVCYIPRKFFNEVQGDDPMEDFMYEISASKIRHLIEAINDGNIRSQFGDIGIFLTVKSTDTLVDALKIMRDEGVDIAAVVLPSGRCKGPVLRKDVESKILETVLSTSEG